MATHERAALAGNTYIHPLDALAPRPLLCHRPSYSPDAACCSFRGVLARQRHIFGIASRLHLTAYRPLMTHLRRSIPSVLLLLWTAACSSDADPVLESPHGSGTGGGSGVGGSGGSGAGAAGSSGAAGTGGTAGSGGVYCPTSTRGPALVGLRSHPFQGVFPAVFARRASKSLAVDT
jgi:hypothetical protein